MAGLALGHGDALEALYRLEAGSVYRYLLALSGDAHAAADATQQAFLALVSRPRDFNPLRGSLGAYLGGIGRHALLAHWQAAGRFESLGDEALAHLPDQAASPEAVLVRRQDVALVHSAIVRLPLVYREALVLVDLQERSYVDAAAIAGCEINTLRTRLHRARQRLAMLLNAGPGETQ